jgi:hypothetical protein
MVQAVRMVQTVRMVQAVCVVHECHHNITATYSAAKDENLCPQTHARSWVRDERPMEERPLRPTLG